MSFLLSLIMGPLGKYLMGFVGIVALVGGAWGYLKYEEHVAADAALAKFNAAQLAQSQKDNAANAAALKEALDYEQVLAKEVTDANDKLSKSVTDTNTWIATQKPVKGAVVNPLFNSTLQRMRGY